MKSHSVKLQECSLPTVLAAKVCQQLKIINSTMTKDVCYLANTNGHFIIKDRDRVQELVDEYSKRMCYYQNCEAPKGLTFELYTEDINPCPCRVKPEKPKVKNDTLDAGTVNENAIINAVASAEEQGNAKVNHTVEPKAPSIIKTRESGGKPLVLEQPVDETDPRFQLVPSKNDEMKASPELDVSPNVGDRDMLLAHKPEIFMGKEAGCEDVAESAVDLDGETAIQMDVKAEKREASEITVDQMNLQVNSRSSLMSDH